MELTREQQDILNGSQGEVMAKVMKSLVMYGETFGADKLVPVTSEYGHTVISFGIGVMKPVYDLYDQLIKAGALSKQKFSADPLPLDKNVPSSFLQDIIFKGIMYSQQSRYEKQLAAQPRLQVVENTAFNSALSGIDLLGFGVDEMSRDASSLVMFSHCRRAIVGSVPRQIISASAAFCLDVASPALAAGTYFISKPLRIFCTGIGFTSTASRPARSSAETISRPDVK